MRMVRKRTGLSVDEMAGPLRALIVPRGAKGSVIYAGGEEYSIPAARPATVKDPTGCGDAYQAGLIYGLNHGSDWETTGRIASLMGAIKIEHHGTQNHRFTMDEFRTRFREEFGREF